MRIELEILDRTNYDIARKINRDDIPEAYVGDVEELIETMEYGAEQHLKGYGFLIKADGEYAGYLMIGEALPWPTDPPEMKEKDYYRLMFFVIDKAYRSQGIGGKAMEMAMEKTCRQFGKRPLVLGCHKDNTEAERFYLKHGFRKTTYMEGNDRYMLRE